MNTAKRIIEAMNVVIEEQRINMMKRYARISQCYANNNSGKEPVKDCNGRFHAPCDGYVDPFSDNIMAGGEYLSFDFEFDERDDEITIGARGRSEPLSKERVLLPVAEAEWFKEQMKEMGIDCSLGGSFDSPALKETVQYCYTTGSLQVVKCMKDIVAEIKKEQSAVRKANKGEAPVGRIKVQGTIVCVKVEPGFAYNSVILKMMVELENGATAWGTVPKAIEADVGVKVEFTATFEQAKDDKTHAFFSRPAVAKPAKTV